MIGTVVRPRFDRGFVFIEANGQDYFCHFSEVVDGNFHNFRAGDHGEFDIEQRRKGMTAVNVRRA